jgi:hypothetical protein
MAAKKNITKKKYPGGWTPAKKAAVRKTNPHIFGGSLKEQEMGHRREEAQDKVDAAKRQLNKAIKQANEFAAKGKASRKKRAKKRSKEK